MADYSRPVALVISNGVYQNSSDVFGIIDPDTGGANTFTVKLSANGLEPITHWGCRTQLEVSAYNALKNMNTTEFKAYVDAKAAEYGRTPIGSITAFKNNVQISADDANFYTFVASLGLQRIQAPL
jgi:hypothetical protein